MYLKRAMLSHSKIAQRNRPWADSQPSSGRCASPADFSLAFTVLRSLGGAELPFSHGSMGNVMWHRGGWEIGKKARGPCQLLGTGSAVLRTRARAQAGPRARASQQPNGGAARRSLSLSLSLCKAKTLLLVKGGLWPRGIIVGAAWGRRTRRRNLLAWQHSLKARRVSREMLGEPDGNRGKEGKDSARDEFLTVNSKRCPVRWIYLPIGGHCSTAAWLTIDCTWPPSWKASVENSLLFPTCKIDLSFSLYPPRMSPLKDPVTT